jgi:hypothetical protein
LEPPLGFAERLALGMVHVGAPVIRTLDVSRVPREIDLLIESAREPLEALALLNDPRHTYAHCFCGVR